MGSRYLITGVQLGMLIGLQNQEERQTLADEVEDKQFVGNSQNDISDDVASVSMSEFK